ncbi:MAG: hypothetical protein ABIH46_04280 [Chloroflexota bacterium]
MRPQRIDFRVLDEGHISYGGRVQEVRYSQGTTPEDFVRIYQELSDKCGLCVTEDFLAQFYVEAYGKDLSLSQREDPPFPYINHLVGFVLDTDYLVRRGTDVGPLVGQFNESGSVDELHHTFHLSGLAAIYASAKCSISFPRRLKSVRSPDLAMNGVHADLKVLNPPDVEKLHDEKGETFESKLREDLCYDIGKAIENRMCVGMEQADLVFIDLGAKSLPLMYLGKSLENWSSRSYRLILPKPVRFRVIFCCMGSLPSNLDRRKEGLPYSFYGTYMDVDPTLWNFVRGSKVKIVHKRGKGRFIL